MHLDFKNVEAVAPAMGNHLVDLSAPEFNGAVLRARSSTGSTTGA
jgi:hypothetical protein